MVSGKIFDEARSNIFKRIWKKIIKIKVRIQNNYAFRTLMVKKIMEGP